MINIVLLFLNHPPTRLCFGFGFGVSEISGCSPPLIAFSNKPSMFQFKKTQVENFFQDSIKILNDQKEAEESYLKVQSDENIFTKNPKDLLLDLNGSDSIVHNYQNKSGLCNLSAMMFIQYLQFVNENFDELLKNKDEKFRKELFDKSQFPEINSALFCGQTVYALRLFFDLAMKHENNPNRIHYDHFFTHFNSLEETIPKLDYEVVQIDDDISEYHHKRKEEVFKDFVSQNIGVFKVIEHKHACALLLTESKAVYVNNSLLTDHPLVCDKDQLVDNWKRLFRWNRHQFGKGVANHTSLFNVIMDLKRFVPQVSIQGGSKKDKNKLVQIILCTILSILLIIFIFLICNSVRKQSCSHFQVFE